MTIWHLKLFIAVAESGSMSGAANQYLIRQPSVSQKIAELERHYGVLLFERLGNRLHITEAGEKLLPMARDVVTRFDFLDESMAAEQRGGRLRIGATVTIGSSLLPELLFQFRAANPHTEVFASVNNTAAVAEKLLNNELDLALVEGKVKSPDLISLPKIDDFLVLACGSRHPFFQRSQLHCRDLAGMEFVMREPGSGTRELFEQYSQAHGLSIRTLLECGNPDAMRSAVRVDNCLAVISVRLLEQDAREGSVWLFRNQDQEWNRTFDLVYHKNKHINGAMRRFCALLEQYRDLEEALDFPMGRLLPSSLPKPSRS